jgi:hypothetical protein
MKQSMPGAHGRLAFATLVGKIVVLAVAGYCVGFFGPEWLHPTHHAQTLASVSYEAATLIVRMWVTGPAGALGFLFAAMIASAISRTFRRR